MGEAPLAPEGTALIFDMDGVIVHSTPLHTEAWQRYLRRHGIDVPREKIEAEMLGRHNDEIVEIFFGPGLPREERFRHGAEKEKLYRELMRPRLEEYLVPGVRQFLARNAARPLALASNAEPANVEFILAESGLRPYFRVVLDGHQVENPKPDPEIYLLAARLLHVRPADCIVFEDSETGVRAAKSAGAAVVGLTTTTDRLADCDLVIADFRDPQLAEWLAAFQPVG